MTGAFRGLRVGVVILLIAATSLAPGSSLAGGLQPEDVQIVSLVSSWCLNCGFPDARTTSANEVFAIGDVGPPWGSCTFKCSVLLHSPDAGRTWEQLAGGLNASQVMLDHRWDNFGDMSAHRVYVVTPNGLEVSTDAGMTFHRILSTAIANRAWRSIVNPGSESGNGPAILMEATQLGQFGYEDFPVDQGTTSPLVFLGSSAHPQSFTFDPGDGTHLWATSSPAPTSASGSGGFSIRLDDCRYVINET